MSNIKGCFLHKSDEWSTPEWLFNDLNDEFHFTLDPCSTDDNCKCNHHFTIKDNGLIQSWKNNVVFCNPPYSNCGAWVKKARFEMLNNNVVSVLLLPARTDTKWFHEYIYNMLYTKVFFICGRLRFSGCKQNAPFPSMIVVFDKSFRRFYE